MVVRVVTRTDFSGDVPITKVHKAFYFCPSMLMAQGIKDLDKHIIDVINKDIEKHLARNIGHRGMVFNITKESEVPTVYIG
jgi:hypothetical protein